MQIISLLCITPLLAATAIAAPGKKNTEDLLERRWWWEGSKASNDWDLHNYRQDYNNDDGNHVGYEGHHHVEDTSTSSADSLTSSSSCAVTTTTAVGFTKTTSITVLTTVTQYRTRHSNKTTHSASITPVFANSTSRSIPLSSGYASGIPSSSAPLSPYYTNTTNINVLLSTAYSTGLPSSSHLTSVLYPNSTSLTVTPFTTHKKTHTEKHRSHHKATSITVSSSMIFIAASSSIPIASSHVTNPATGVPVTTTVSGTAAPTGTPLPHALLCGVHGFPVGDFFLGQLVESRAGEDITLQSCYQFCAGIYGIDMGCLAIEFYPEPGTDAPRCNLYSRGVAESLDMIIPQVPNVWYDLGCAVPVA